MTDIREALDSCLEAMAHGASLEKALSRYPDVALDLRPLLEAATLARGASRMHVSLDVRRRGRARLQQKVREAEQHRSAGRGRITPVPRALLTTILVGALALTSTGLVSASSSSLPGQQLYPVKRSWEQVRLLFAFSPEQREVIQSDFEQERLNEADELLGRKMSAPITFSGVLAKRNDGQWLVSGIPVSVGADTNLPTAPVTNGAPLTIMGVTGPDGVVQAQQIQILQPGTFLPPLEPSENYEPGKPSSSEEVEGSPSATPGTSGPTAKPSTYQFSGVVQSISGNQWLINGQVVYVNGAAIDDGISVGSTVRFQGYYSADGKFTAQSITRRNSGGNGGSSGGANGSGDGSQPGGGDGGGEGEGEGP